MQKLFVMLLLVLPLCSFAQSNDPKYEIFAGYSYLHTNPGGGKSSADASGWNASVDYNLTRHWGAKADFDGHYCCNSQKEHNFLFGPQYQFQASHTRLFMHALVGASNASAPAAHYSDAVLAWAAGGGFDLSFKAKSHWALRLAQLDYLGTNYRDSAQHNLRYSGGIVFTFGKL